MKSFTRFFLRPVPAALLTRRAWPIVLIFITGTALSIVVFFLVHSLETEREIKDFEQIAIERIGHLENSLEEAVVDKVHSIRALFAASNFVDRKEFKVFVSHLDQHGTTIQAFEWIPRVPESSRAAYEKAA
ncbi:MAG: CHASE domain-containing protein, partial [SAR324 cluster bacterium]|nr:CHASE domain-containing protein [SAR324 cluster bacterium]